MTDRPAVRWLPATMTVPPNASRLPDSPDTICQLKVSVSTTGLRPR